MKYLSTIMIISLLSCSNRNEITTQLLNDKKTTEDSIKEFGNFETYYLQKAKDEMHSTGDTIKRNLLIDSSTYYFGKGHAQKGRLKAIEFSLDSISKMK